MRKRGGAFLWVVLGILLVTAAGWAATTRTMASERSSSPGESVVCAEDGVACLDAVPVIGETTAGACRMRPECSTDADCNAWCPTAGGKCVHSKCPIRVCKCN